MAEIFWKLFFLRQVVGSLRVPREPTYVPFDRSALRCCLSLQSISTTGKMSDKWMILWKYGKKHNRDASTSILTSTRSIGICLTYQNFMGILVKFINNTHRICTIAFFQTLQLPEKLSVVMSLPRIYIWIFVSDVPSCHNYTCKGEILPQWNSFICEAICRGPI